MKLGIDSYSFHRFFGDVRLGEMNIQTEFPRGTVDVIKTAHRLGAEVVSLQTCFLPSASLLDIEGLRVALGDIEPVIAWGHPEGLAFGWAEDAAEDLSRWIKLAPALGCRLVRLVAGNSRTDRRGKSLDFLAHALSPLVREAGKRGTLLALENHADLTASELEQLLLLIDDPTLGVCLDTANALRVGDDPLAAALRLLAHVRMVHLKDVEGGEFEPSVGPRSVTYGMGVVPVREIVGALADSGFAGSIVVELGYLGRGVVDEDALLTECFDWLVDVREGAQRG